MLAVSMPNFATSAALVDTATKCLATDVSSPPKPASDQARAVWALVMVSSVVKVFEETMNSVSAGSRSRTASAKSVPSTLETNRNVMRAVAVMLERLVGHDRPEVGAADADVDDVADALAGVALPLAAADAVGRSRPSCRARRGPGAPRSRRRRRWTAPLRGAQGDVQDRALLRDVDLLSPEHGVDARSQAGFLGQPEEQLEGFVGDAVLRVVQEEAHSLGRHPLAAAGIVREEIRGDASREPLIVGFEGLPGRAIR